MGASPSGFVANFALGKLELSGGSIDAKLQLIAAFQSQGINGDGEALYVDNLVLGRGSMLDLNGFNLYYNRLQDNGGNVIENSGVLVQIPEPGALALLAMVVCFRMRNVLRVLLSTQ